MTPEGSTVAGCLARFLAERGVGHVYGVPGGENVPVLEAFRRWGIDYVLMHHETAAGYAADVAGQMSGRPGVCMSTVGPGAVNLAAAAAAATLERSPVLAITADIDTGWKDSVRHMKVDLVRLFGASCKGSITLGVDGTEADLQAAWDLALAEPRGAVHVAVAPDVAAAELGDDAILVGAGPDGAMVGAPGSAMGDTAGTPARSASGPPNVGTVVDRILGAGRGFMLAGVGVESGEAHEALLDLADALDWPIAVTPKAKGHFPESHRLFAGVFTAYGDGALRRALSDSDLILGVGLDSVDFVTSRWDNETPVIAVGPTAGDDEALTSNLVDSLRWPLVDALTELMRRLGGPSQTGTYGEREAARLRAEIDDAVRVPPPPAGAGVVGVSDLIDGMREAMPETGALTVDVGAFKLVVCQQWRTDTPKSFFVANGLSAMGYALPAALALRAVDADRPVIAVAGDGALLMYAGELATVGRLGRPLVILVVVDEALALIRLKQLRQDVPVFGTEFGATDFGALARAHGLGYELIDGSEEMANVLGRALDAGGPVLVEARVDKADYDRFR